MKYSLIIFIILCLSCEKKSNNNYYVFVILDSLTNYGYYIDGVTKDTVYSYRIADSFKDGYVIVPESRIDQHLKFEEDIITSYNSLNGRTSYVYEVNKESKIRRLVHTVPHEVQVDGKFGLLVNQDTLQLNDTLSMKFIPLANTPHQVFIEENEGYSLINSKNENGEEVYKVICSQKGIQKIKVYIEKEGVIGKNKYAFEYKYFVY